MKKLAIILGLALIVVIVSSFTAPATETVTVKHDTIVKDAAHGGVNKSRSHEW